MKHPADRRRLAGWAENRGVTLNTVDPLDSDVLVLSGAANFGYWLKCAKQPVVIDLVDGYLSEHPSFAKDVLRNIIRSIDGSSNFRWVKYTNHLSYACKTACTIVVASPEQKEAILHLNSSIEVILDDHFEIDNSLNDLKKFKQTESDLNLKNFIFWEGFGFTLKHFKFIANDLDRFLFEKNFGMYLVTNTKFPRYGRFIGKIHTQKFIKKLFPNSWRKIEIIPWSISNLVKYAHRSRIAVIPITPNDKFANMKSENKLLSMWHLCIPTVTSPIPSYKRVLLNASQPQASVSQFEWYSKLSKLLNDSIELKSMTKSSFNYISTHHSHDQLMRKWDRLIFHSTKSSSFT